MARILMLRTAEASDLKRANADHLPWLDVGLAAPSVGLRVGIGTPAAASPGQMPSKGCTSRSIGYATNPAFLRLFGASPTPERGQAHSKVLVMVPSLTILRAHDLLL